MLQEHQSKNGDENVTKVQGDISTPLTNTDAHAEPGEEPEKEKWFY